MNEKQNESSLFFFLPIRSNSFSRYFFFYIKRIGEEIIQIRTFGLHVFCNFAPIQIKEDMEKLKKMGEMTHLTDFLQFIKTHAYCAHTVRVRSSIIIVSNVSLRHTQLLSHCDLYLNGVTREFQFNSGTIALKYYQKQSQILPETECESQSSIAIRKAFHIFGQRIFPVGRGLAN